MAVTGPLSPKELSEVQALVQHAHARGLPVPDGMLTLLLHHQAIQRGLFLYESFPEYVAALNPSLLSYEHIPLVLDTAERVIRGEILRLLVWEPPRYFKSEVFSRLLPSYFLRQFPTLTVGLAAYGSDLAWELSEDAREYYQATHGVFRRDTQAKKRWGTDQGGEMWAAGVGGPILGRGFHLGIVDDPVDPDQAISPTYIRRFQRWWPGKFLSRQEPGARVIVVMQRLGVDDPVDFLLRREVGENTDNAPEHWHVLALDELKSDEPLGRWDGPRGLPSTCTLIEDNREVGEPLAPSRFDLRTVKKLQVAAGPLVAAAQRQQRPMRPSGDFWKKDWFRTYKTLPDHAYDGGKDWDTAYTKKELNAASAFVESYRGPGGPSDFPIYIHDVDWRWLKFPELVKWMLGQTGPHYVEEKATGKSVVQSLEAYDIKAEEVPVKGDKLARASAVQPVVSNRRVFVREEVLDTLLYGERQGLLRITAEALQADDGHLDANDAFVQALTRHLGLHGKRKKVAAFR